jgi:hypothetical protein
MDEETEAYEEEMRERALRRVDPASAVFIQTNRISGCLKCENENLAVCYCEEAIEPEPDEDWVYL